MEFTKEQKEIIEEMYNLQLSGSVFGARIKKAFPEVLEPKRKKIVVEIEFVDLETYPFSIDNIREILEESIFSERKIKVKELPEVFTREDMLEFKFGTTEFECDIWDKALDRFLSERNKITNKK